MESKEANTYTLQSELYKEMIGEHEFDDDPEIKSKSLQYYIK